MYLSVSLCVCVCGGGGGGVGGLWVWMHVHECTSVYTLHVRVLYSDCLCEISTVECIHNGTEAVI